MIRNIALFQGDVLMRSVPVIVAEQSVLQLMIPRIRIGGGSQLLTL